MPYTSPASPVSGAVISKTTFGDVVKADLDFLANPPACRVTKAAAQSIATSALTAVTFDTERYDTDTMHDNVTNNTRITIKTAGLYTVGAAIEWAAGGTSFRLLLIRLNGTTPIAQLIGPPETTGVATDQTLSTVYKFAVNDYIEVMAQQNSGGALNVSKINNSSPEFWATWIGLG